MSVDTARSIPIGFDTDVNAAALAELHYGEHRYVLSVTKLMKMKMSTPVVVFIHGLCADVYSRGFLAYFVSQRSVYPVVLMHP